MTVVDAVAIHVASRGQQKSAGNPVPHCCRVETPPQDIVARFGREIESFEAEETLRWRTGTVRCDVERDAENRQKKFNRNLDFRKAYLALIYGRCWGQCLATPKRQRVRRVSISSFLQLSPTKLERLKQSQFESSPDLMFRSYRPLSFSSHDEAW